jgi:hypothetical protein
VADEATNAEIARRLDDIYRILVGRPEYVSDQRLVERRFVEFERDLADLRSDIRDGKTRHDADVETLRRQVTEDRKARSTSWRDFVYAGMVPVLVGLVVALITLWTTK